MPDIRDDVSTHARKKDQFVFCMHLWEQFSHYIQFVLKSSKLKTHENHVACKLLKLWDLLKWPAAGNGNNTHSNERTQRITSIFVQHD